MATAPKFGEWVKQLGDSTPGITLKRMTPEQRQAAYKVFLAEFRRTGDVAEASNNAAQQTQASIGQQARAAAAKPEPSKSTPTSAPATPTTAPAADVASQTAQNPQASALTQGRFSAQASTTSLFGSGGIDPTTPIPGYLPHDPNKIGQTSIIDFQGRGATTPTVGHFHDARESYATGQAPPDNVDKLRGTTLDQPVTQTADQWLSGLYKMAPAELAKLQTQLYGAGWYDPSDVPSADVIPFGKVDPATIAAYEQAMIQTARYNQAGKTLALDDVIAQGAPRVPGAGKKVKKPTQQFANPVDLKNQLQQSADTLTGQDMTAAQAEQFAQYYQAQEQASYAQYAQSGEDRAAGLGGAYTGPPSAQGAAEAFIRQQDPNAVQAYGMASRAQEFLNLLGSATGR